MPSSPQEFWDIAVRRKWIILGCVLLAVIVSIVLIRYLPKSYRSSSLLLVENQKIPESYVKGTVGGSIEQRLMLIQQQVMSRTLLTQIIEEFGLYPELVNENGVEAAIGMMRESIQVRTVGRRDSVESVIISFAHEDPRTAQQVTSRLASHFIDENLKMREQLVEGTTDFLDHELDLARARLEKQEEAISRFKSTYMGELPQQMEPNLRALDRLQAEKTSLNENLIQLTDRMALIEKDIEEYLRTGVPKGETKLDPLVRRLRELEERLLILSAEYKETYPDITLIKQEIEQVKAQLAQKYPEIQEARSSDDTNRYDPYLRGLENKRGNLQIKIDSLNRRIQHVSEKIAEYEGRVERTPQREQELMILMRDYNNMQENYRSLLDKKLNAHVAENLEKRQKGEQFRVLDPANLPYKPEKPDPQRILLMGVAAGGGLGGGVALLLELLIPVFRRPEEAEGHLGLPLIAAIPAFQLAYRHVTKLSSSKAMLPAHEATTNGDSSGDPLVQLPAQHSPKSLNRWGGRRRRHTDTPGKHGDPWASLSMEWNLVAKWRPHSVVTEQFRVGATRLASSDPQQESRIIVVTSAVTGEGKTATVTNLGYVLARDLGKSTVLIDCDLKRPMMHRYLGTGETPGLSEMLEERLPVDMCLHQVGEWPLWVIPCGGTEVGRANLGKLYQLPPLITQLRERFDLVLIDSPPILPLADMNVLAKMADLLVLVVRAGVTKRDVVQTALRTLNPTTQVGMVLTEAWTEGVPYYVDDYEYTRAAPTRGSGTPVHED